MATAARGVFARRAKTTRRFTSARAARKWFRTSSVALVLVLSASAVSAAAETALALRTRTSATEEVRNHFRAARAEVKRRVVFARRANTPLAAVAIFACHGAVC